MLASLNGDFSPPYGAAFDLPPAGLEGGLCPALTARSGLYRCNLGGGGRPFRHAPARTNPRTRRGPRTRPRLPPPETRPASGRTAASHAAHAAWRAGIRDSYSFTARMAGLRGAIW